MAEDKKKISYKVAVNSLLSQHLLMCLNLHCTLMNLRAWDTHIHECKLCVCAQAVQQILKQLSEDVMAVSQNLTVKGRFLFK